MVGIDNKLITANFIFLVAVGLLDVGVSMGFEW